MLLVSILAYSEKVKLVSINAKCATGIWEGWRPCNLNADFDMNKGTIVIYSTITQKFTHIKFDKLVEKTFTIFISEAIDQNGNKAVLTIFLQENSTCLKISYSDGDYMYVLQ